MKSFQIFLIAVVVLAAAVYFTAGRANRPKGVSAMKLEALADAAEKGNPEAALEAAVRYGFGIRGVKEDWKESYVWASQAAKEGNEDALAAKAEMEVRGLGAMEEGQAAVDQISALAAGGNAGALYAVGFGKMMSENAPTRREGAAQIRAAADKGLPRAQYLLGLLMLKGDPDAGIDKNEAEGARLIEKAAKGEPDALAAIGLCYLKGIGVPSDSLEAYTWLAVAAEENDRWQKAKTEAASGISGEAERDALPAVTFTRREYGPGKYHPNLAAHAAEYKRPFSGFPGE
jgi:TPR repeat protein